MHTSPCDTQLYTTRTLPGLVCAHVSPNILVKPSTQTKPVTTALVADITAHTDGIASIAGQVDILDPACVGIHAVWKVAFGIGDCGEREEKSNR